MSSVTFGAGIDIINQGTIRFPFDQVPREVQSRMSGTGTHILNQGLIDAGLARLEGSGTIDNEGTLRFSPSNAIWNLFNQGELTLIRRSDSIRFATLELLSGSVTNFIADILQFPRANQASRIIENNAAVLEIDTLDNLNSPNTLTLDNNDNDIFADFGGKR